jgi:hypothetical protein
MNPPEIELASEAELLEAVELIQLYYKLSQLNYQVRISEWVN